MIRCVQLWTGTDDASHVANSSSCEPGHVLLAEDTAGSGHQWRLEGTDPWRRMYVVLADGADVPFVPY
jgi:hypothetical protein